MFTGFQIVPLRLSTPLLCLLVISLVPSLKGQGAPSPDPCSVQEFRVVGRSAVAIRCANNATGLTGTGNIFLVGDFQMTQLSANVAISHPKGKTWLVLILSGTESNLKPKQKYRLSLTYSGTDAGGQSVTAAPVAVDFDTNETVTISPSNINTLPERYKATAHVGFSTDGKRLGFEKLEEVAPNRTKPKTEPCQIPLQDDTKKRTSVTGNCSTLDSLPSEAPSAADLASLDPELVAVYDIILDEVPHAVLIPSGLPVKNIFGSTLKIDPKSRLSPQKAPATKDAAHYYINVNYAAGRGTVPAWVLDGKISPDLGMLKGFTFTPLAAANVGNNKLKGQTYTDTINFGATAQRIFQPNDILQELLFVPGTIYETDKKFDRDNLLATVDLRYNFAKLYHTQAIGTLQAFYSALQAAEQKLKEDPKAQVYIPQLDDTKPVALGYALDFHTGMETGGAIVDTTVTASSGKATQTLPAYSIIRIVPQVHGLLELWKFSLDATMTGRYLVATENTVGETASHSLFLTRVQGWKGIGVLTFTYNLDSQGHFAANITFKDGFAPPAYVRVNAVQAGILLKY